jgi:hypothetical protein
MRKSKIETEEFLGPFPDILQVGGYQHMNYQDGDSGPFHKSEAEREASKFDHQTGVSKRKIRKKETMEIDLRAEGVRAKGNKVAIIEFCKQNNVPYKVFTETIIKGLNGKPVNPVRGLTRLGLSTR